MLGSIRGAQTSVTIDLPATVEWKLSDLREHGEAQITLTRNSAAWIEEVLSDEGGFFVEIPTRFGVWRGIADVPTFSPEGAKMVVRNITHWAAIRLVGTRTYYGLTAGALAREAIRQGLLTALPITIGTILEAPPIIPEYEFRGQSVLDVFTDLSEETGQTWEINDDFQISWIPKQGIFREVWLIDDGNLLRQVQTQTLGEQYQEIIEREPSGRSFTSYNDVIPLYPQQKEESIGR